MNCLSTFPAANSHITSSGERVGHKGRAESDKFQSIHNSSQKSYSLRNHSALVPQLFEELSILLALLFYSYVSTYPCKLLLFSLCMEKSRDVTNTSKLLLFITGVNMIKMTQVLVSVHSTYVKTVDKGMLEGTEKTVHGCSSQWTQLKCVTTNDGRNINATVTGLVDHTYRVCYCDRTSWSYLQGVLL